MLGVAKIVKDAKVSNGSRRMLGMAKIIRYRVVMGGLARLIILYTPSDFLGYFRSYTLLPYSFSRLIRS